MSEPKRGKINAIYFPNNAATGEDQSAYKTYGENRIYCDEIREIKKPDPRGWQRWLQVIKNGHVVAEIKESVCDIYYERGDK